jgi:hypothetical protein
MLKDGTIRKYCGFRNNETGEHGVDVVIKRTGESMLATPLDIKPSMVIYNHSNEFEWGYPGSGPAQLALAILFDVTGDRIFSFHHHQAFKDDFVSTWPDMWEIYDEEIQDWCKRERWNPAASPYLHGYVKRQKSNIVTKLFKRIFRGKTSNAAN